MFLRRSLAHNYKLHVKKKIVGTFGDFPQYQKAGYATGDYHANNEITFLQGWAEKFIGWLRRSCATAMKFGMH